MDIDKKAFFKSKIIAEIDSLQEKIIELKEITKPIPPENAIGRISRMDAINNRSVNEAALRTAENKFKKLHFALDKVDDNNFGICDRCSNTIPEGRLMIMPESNLCINCAQR